MSETENDTGNVPTQILANGTLVFEENDPGQYMYVLRRGKVRIFRRVGESEIVLAVLEAGDFFGEMALLEDQPRSASAMVVEEAEVIEFGRETFATMLTRHPTIAVRMMRKLASRIRDLDRRLHTLMLEGGLARAVEVLQWLSRNAPNQDGYARIPIAQAHVDIANHAGISPQELDMVLERLHQSDCIREKDGFLFIAKKEKLDEYHEFLHMKRKYDPEQVHVSAQPAASGPDDHQQAISRLLRALQIAPEDLQNTQNVLSEQYRRYLEMKQRFEVNDVKGQP